MNLGRNYEICLRARPGLRWEILLSHINESFSAELQIRLVFIYFGTFFRFLSATADCDASYAKTVLTNNQTTESIAEIFVYIRIFRLAHPNRYQAMMKFTKVSWLVAEQAADFLLSIIHEAT